MHMKASSFRPLPYHDYKLTSTTFFSPQHHLDIYLIISSASPFYICLSSTSPTMPTPPYHGLNKQHLYQDISSSPLPLPHLFRMTPNLFKSLSPTPLLLTQPHPHLYLITQPHPRALPHDPTSPRSLPYDNLTHTSTLITQPHPHLCLYDPVSPRPLLYDPSWPTPPP